MPFNRRLEARPSITRCASSDSSSQQRHEPEGGGARRRGGGYNDGSYCDGPCFGRGARIYAEIHYAINSDGKINRFSIMPVPADRRRGCVVLAEAASVLEFWLLRWN